MSKSEDEEENLAEFLESEFLSEVSDEDEDSKDIDERPAKRLCTEDDLRNNNNIGDVKNDVRDVDGDGGLNAEGSNSRNDSYKKSESRIETGILSKIPPELFLHILKFLSSEDLISCSQVCKFLNNAACDESLWRPIILCTLGLLKSYKKLREVSWKKLYFQRDEEDITQSVRNCPPEFKEYYIQMYSAKRSQAPLLSQVYDDRIILDKTVADQVSIWKRNKGLSDKVVTDHTCSGEVCTYFQIGNVFICEKTGNVHVCDDTCKEIITDPENELLVCTISGGALTDYFHCLKQKETSKRASKVLWLTAEPFMGAGRFARAYLLGYNCADEKELEATLRFC